MKNKQYTKEEIEKLERVKAWNKDPNKKFTRDIITDAVSLIFRDYKDPTEEMSLNEKEEFQEVFNEDFRKRLTEEEKNKL